MLLVNQCHCGLPIAEYARMCLECENIRCTDYPNKVSCVLLAKYRANNVFRDRKRER